MIELEHVAFRYAEQTVLQNITCAFEEGQTVCIIGASGAGKSTLLRLLMGLIQAESGEIRGLSGKHLSVVFQEDRLLEDMNAADNLRLVDPHLPFERVLEILSSLALSDAGNKPVSSLSGGMRRRVALARCLVRQADLYLMDEPFTALDEDTRAFVLRETARRLYKQTAVIVTHRPSDATILNARLLELREGMLV